MFFFAIIGAIIVGVCFIFFWIPMEKKAHTYTITCDYCDYQVTLAAYSPADMQIAAERMMKHVPTHKE